MATKKQSAEAVPTLLQEITEEFRANLYTLQNIIGVAKDNCHGDAKHELVVAAYKYSEILFSTYLRLDDLAQAEAAEGRAS